MPEVQLDRLYSRPSCTITTRNIASNGIVLDHRIRQRLSEIDLDGCHGLDGASQTSAFSMITILQKLPHRRTRTRQSALPPIAPVPARVSFAIEWSGLINRERIVNQSQDFTWPFHSDQCTIRWSAEQDGFIWSRRRRSLSATSTRSIATSANGFVLAL